MLKTLRVSWFFGGIVLSFGLFSFQNCAKGLEVGAVGDQVTVSEHVAASEQPVPVPASENPSAAQETLVSMLARTVTLQRLDSSLRVGTLDDQCLTSSTYDACIFWKNPSATRWIRQGSLLPELTNVNDVYPATSLEAYQRFGVNVRPLMTAGKLKSSSWDVFFRTGTSTKNYFLGLGGSLKFSLSQGQASTLAGQRFGLEQIQTFYFLDAFEKFMQQNAGGFYASAKGVQVNAVDTTVLGNSYFDSSVGPGAIDLGVNPGQANRVHPDALNAEVALHEAGHANLHYANQALAEGDDTALVYFNCSPTKQYFITTYADLYANATAVNDKLGRICGPNVTGDIHHYTAYCPKNTGCWRAMDEGQADFFAMAFFARMPSVGELVMGANGPRYWHKRGNVNRSNVQQVMGFSVREDFNGQTISVVAEIHDMAEIFSEMLFEVYADVQVDRTAFLKTVSESMGLWTDRSTFSTVKDQLVAIDGRAFASANSKVIKRVFEARGF